MKSMLIKNVKVIVDNISLLRNVLVVDGRIDSILHEDETPTLSADKTVEGYGHLLIPGMIDVHIHGAEGRDMMDGDPFSVQTVSKVCAKTGCTSFLATSVSSTIEDLLGMIKSVRRIIGKEPGAKIVGFHIEGPYLNAKRKGMQNEKFLRHPEINEMEQILHYAGSLIKMVTLAPELSGSLEMIHYLKQKEIVVAAAHSDATYEEAKCAFHNGVSHVTHCFNGMRPMHHRDPGLVLAAFEEEHVSVQAIVDNVHLHPAIVRLIYREKGPGKMLLITDALQAMGMGDGIYAFGGHKVTVNLGVAKLDNGSLASSTVTMNMALKNTVDSGIPLGDAVQMATQTPADVLSLPHKGRMKKGADADLVLLNDQFEVLHTIIGGRIVYSKYS